MREEKAKLNTIWYIFLLFIEQFSEPYTYDGYVDVDTFAQYAFICTHRYSETKLIQHEIKKKKKC